MPDKRTHRGKHPADERLFADDQLEALRTAVAEYSWLLTRRYATDSALKLVGDRHSLTARQRTAVMRSACSDQALQYRRQKQITPADLGGRSLGIDGYNLLITIESALSGGLILVGRDGCYRDLASIHGTYRKVEETIPALELIVAYLAAQPLARIDWYLDSPVSNSGRLKALLAEILEDRGLLAPDHPTWNIELVHSPDAVLADYAGVVATSDSVVLDRCRAHVNLAREIINSTIPGAWKVKLQSQS
jgi:hypothetical protein